MTEKVVTEKVMAYITSGDRLLVFSHPYHPDAGIQVPAGTIENGELPEQAVLREVHEETGLDHLEIKAYLGVQDYDVSPHGLVGIHRRHVFHLVLHGQAPELWRHLEKCPSEGTPQPIEFEFFWVKFPDEVPGLSYGQGVWLSRLTLGQL